MPTTLLDLPLELFRTVLTACVANLGIRAAIRLRLVAKPFNAELSVAISRSRALDDPPYTVSKELLVNYLAERALEDGKSKPNQSRQIHLSIERALKGRACDDEDYRLLLWRFAEAQVEACLADPIGRWGKIVFVDEKRAREPIRYAELVAGSVLGIEEEDWATIRQDWDAWHNGKETYYSSPMYYLVITGQAGYVRRLLEGMAHDRELPLVSLLRSFAVLAAKLGHVDMVYTLLDPKWESAPRPEVPNAENPPSQIACQAVYTRNLPLIDWLCKRCAIRLSHPALIRAAAAAGWKELFELSLEAGAELDSPQTIGTWRPIISEAATHGHLDIAQLLLDRGADPNFGKFPSQLPLSHAAASGYTRLFDVLVAAGADISSAKVNSPFRFAVVNGQVHIVQRFLQAWTEPSVEQIRGIAQAFDSAVTRGYDSMVRLFLDHGVADKDGIYPQDLKVKRAAKLPPIALAYLEGQHHIVKTLREYGASFDEHTQSALTNRPKLEP